MKYINGYNNRDEIVLLYRDDHGDICSETHRAEHIAYFSVEESKTWEVDAIAELIIDDDVIDVTQEGEWYRVSWKGGRYDKTAWNERTNQLGMWVSFRETKCKQLESYGIKSYEADVSPLRRYMSDHDVQIARPKRVYLDIETDSRCTFVAAKEGKARLLSWALVDETGKQMYGLLSDETDDAEWDLFSALFEALIPYDQIVAWNGDGFDFPVLRARSDAIGLRIDWRRWLLLDHMLVFKRNNQMSADSGDEKQSFALESIAQSLLGEGKHDVDGSKTWEYWVTGGESREKLLKYNIQDTDLLRRIEEKTGYIELYQTLCEVCRVFPDTGNLKPTKQVDAFMLRLGVEKGVHFPTKWYGDSEGEKYRGAYVMEPKTRGIAKNVHVCDFASLYPSIMISWNLSPETKLRIGTFDTLGPNECLSPSTQVVTRTDRKGIICVALEKLLALRETWNKKRAECAPGTPEAKEAERRTNAYKTAANSFYGVCGTPYSRFYDKHISESTTLNGVWLIKTTEAYAVQRKWQVVYGDSVTGDRTVIVRDPSDNVRIIPFERLWNEGVIVPSDRKECATLEGWYALTHSGWNPIKCIIRHRAGKDIHTITTKHGQVNVTADHSIISRNGPVTPETFVDARHSFIRVPVPKEHPVDIVDVFEYVKDYSLTHPYKKRTVTNRFRISDDPNFIELEGWKINFRIRRFYKQGSEEFQSLLRLIIAYVCDGSASLRNATTTRYMLSIAKDNIELMNILANDLKRISPDCHVFGPFWTESVYVVRSGTSSMASFFAALCGYKSKGKRLPSFMFKLNEESFRIVLDAIAKGDGHIDKSQGLSYTSISQELIAGISYILKQFDIEHSWCYRESKRAWTLRTRRGGERVSRYKITHSVRNSSPDEYVYDLSVENDQSFVDGIGQVLLHNTDSLFVHGPTKEDFNRFVEQCNSQLYPEELKKLGCPVNKIKLAYEKEFERVTFTAAKRYIGRYTHYKGKPATDNSKPEIKGLEYKRGDTNRIARELQGEVIDHFNRRVEDVEVYRDLITRCKERVLTSSLELKDIVMSKSISKDLIEYTGKGVPAHVRLARTKEANGEEVRVGSRVSYIVVDAKTSPMKVVPVDQFDGVCDRYYLWENLIYPPTQRLLQAMFPDEDWTQWEKARPSRRYNPQQLALPGLE